jgi:glucose/arabinose dehydrogenase
MKMTKRGCIAVLGTMAAAAVFAVPSGSAQGPPPPTSTNGNPVSTVATGVAVPTAFAFAGDTIFVGGGPAEKPNSPTGLFTLANGQATRVPKTPKFVFGLAWHHNQLYVSTGRSIVVFRGWNGTQFADSRTLVKPKGTFAGFNGLAFGPDGRLYAGVSFREKYDLKRDPSRYAQSVVRMSASGKHITVIARGLRQPFQLTFLPRNPHPFVGVLGPEKRIVPKDAIVNARAGQDYGYPNCHFGDPKTCQGYSRPLILLPKHASPMGIDHFGKRLYFALFGGLKKETPVVVSAPATRGAKPKVLLQGFVAPIVALRIHKGTLYVGELTGTIYSVKL